MFLFLTYYLQGTLRYSPLKSGFAFLPFSVGIVIGADSPASCCLDSAGATCWPPDCCFPAHPSRPRRPARYPRGKLITTKGSPVSQQIESVTSQYLTPT
jgi:hypothetical protein